MRATMLATLTALMMTGPAAAQKNETYFWTYNGLPQSVPISWAKGPKGYRAFVIYNKKERGPEYVSDVGVHETLEKCREHSRARFQAMINRKLLYGGSPYCLYVSKYADPVVLR